MNGINELGQITAVLSFAIGTCLLAFLFYFGESNFIIQLGLTFIIIAFIINIVLLSVLVGAAILYPDYRDKLLKTGCLMLLNIPIAILYFYMVITFPSYLFTL